MDRARKWSELFEGGFVPEDPKKAAGWIVMSDAWKALDRQCPGFLLGSTADPKTGERSAPNRFTLYRVDIDNDGSDDTVLFRAFRAGRTDGYHYDHHDRKSCRNSRIFFSDRKTRIMRFDGKNYLAAHHTSHHTWGIAINEVDAKSRKVNRDGDWTCSFHGWQTDFDELTDYLTKPWTLKWRK